MRRDLRWCQGNIQYMKLLGEPGLHPVSRFQLAWAILMFLSIAAWPILTVLLPVLAFNARSVPDYPGGLAAGLYVTFLAMHLSPKLTGFFEVLANGTAWRYGGRARLVAGAVMETLFSLALEAISRLRISIFMLGLAAGKTIRWSGQARDAHGVSWAEAFSSLWPQSGAGLAVCGALYFISPKLLLVSLPLTGGWLLAVPFAVLTAQPRLGQLLQRAGLCATPEELDPPNEIEAVRHGQSPALLAPSSCSETPA
jgi:membrane glycosyltransferase